MLVEANLEMSFGFANIAHITVWTGDFVNKSASQNFSTGSFKEGNTVFSFLRLNMSWHSIGVGSHSFLMSLAYDSLHFPLY